ncbi:MAG: hypothetical protein IKA42_06545, partial [Clostridia bacterium]|nr:hypothetical protein [Clostridia bacterium]
MKKIKEPKDISGLICIIILVIGCIVGCVIGFIKNSPGLIIAFFLLIAIGFGSIVIYLYTFNWFEIDDQKIVSRNPLGVTHTVYWEKILEIHLTNLDQGGGIPECSPTRYIDGYIFITKARKRKDQSLYNNSQAFLRIRKCEVIDQAIKDYYHGDIIDKRRPAITIVGKPNDFNNFYISSEKISWQKHMSVLPVSETKWNEISHIEKRVLYNHIYKNTPTVGFVLFKKDKNQKDNDHLFNKIGYALRIHDCPEIREAIDKYYHGEIIDKTK